MSSEIILPEISKDTIYKLADKGFINNFLMVSDGDEEMTRRNFSLIMNKAKEFGVEKEVYKAYAEVLEAEKDVWNVTLPRCANTLSVISAPDLQKANLPPVRFLVNGILPEGTSFISAPSKIGKSWFVLDMGLSIASGGRFMKYTTNKAGVLYLALEDSLSRLQSRMNKVLDGKPAPEQFYFTTEAPTLSDGLIEVLEEHLKQFPETKLIIIDTLQKIRGQAQGRETIYAQDYREMGMLKAFADKQGVSIFFVHHTRKMKDDDDVFNMISGTNGIMGAADTIFVMVKDKRDDSNAVLHITGRDVSQINDMVTFDKDIWKWKVIGNADEIREQRATEEFRNNPVYRTIEYAVSKSDNGWWSGKASELLELGEFVTGNAISSSPKKLGCDLRKLEDELLKRGNIKMEVSKNGSGGKSYSFHEVVTSESNR